MNVRMDLEQLAHWTHGVLHGANRLIEQVTIDTRTLREGDCFIALPGVNFDGHDFITQAEKSGAAAIIAQRPIQTSLPWIQVNNSRLALAQIAGAWKAQLNLRTVAITGSNGKTTVKEMIARILACQHAVGYTLGNLNNEIGVPLTLLSLRPEHQFAVIEMGANHAGEIAENSMWVKQDVALITNVGSAHIEGFGSLQGVAKAKNEIYQGLHPEGIAVLNRDDAFYSFWLSGLCEHQTLTFGCHPDADVRVGKVDFRFEKDWFQTNMEIIYSNQPIHVGLKLAGRHNVINALAAAACAIACGIALPVIKQGLELMEPVRGRMQPGRGKQGNWVINDTYNANPDSFAAALEALNVAFASPKWVVMGALGELGEDSAKIHGELGHLFKKLGVKRLFAQGRDSIHTVEAFGAAGQYFDHQQDLIQAVESSISGQEVILVKGSRFQKMENVVYALLPQV